MKMDYYLIYESVINNHIPLLLLKRPGNLLQPFYR